MNYKFKNRVVWYRQGRIQFSNKVQAFSIKHFIHTLELVKNLSSSHIVLDFSHVDHAYPNGMVPIIAVCRVLQGQGYTFGIILPKESSTRQLFIDTNWAHWLCPSLYKKSDTHFNRHLVSQYFTDGFEQKECVDKFMDVVLRSMPVSKNVVSGLEWSINEITDNVLNHSECSTGGIVQAITYPGQHMISFTVADAGRGILTSLKEGYPHLTRDSQAIGEAIKVGVTRNNAVGQGNGLAGTIRITTLSGGSTDITSGRARLVVQKTSTTPHHLRAGESFPGTIISGKIITSSAFDISEALSFGKHKYFPSNIIDNQYELADQDCLRLALKNETTGFGNRPAGKQLRQKVENLLSAKPTFPIIIEWDGIPLVSSSFADEFMGKLFLDMGPIAFSARIRNKGMEPLVIGLLDKAITQRLTQAADEQ